MCEVTREIFDLAVDIESGKTMAWRTSKIKKKCRELLRIGKKINRRMYEYNKSDNREWWEQNTNYERSLRRRLGYRHPDDLNSTKI